MCIRDRDVKGASPENPAELNVVDEIFAGSYSLRRIGPKEAVRIMTGAPIPVSYTHLKEASEKITEECQIGYSMD